MFVNFFLLITMIFCHIVDDYYLQGWLASAKQKSWWKDNAPDEMYKHDYIVALFMHSFSWTFMITLPTIIHAWIFGGIFYPITFVGNVLIHMMVDNEKANKKTINLITDQSIHMLQIISLWWLTIS